MLMQGHFHSISEQCIKLEPCLQTERIWVGAFNMVSVGEGEGEGGREE